MWQRFYRHDLAVIAHYLGTLVVMVACFMLVPLLVSVLFAEWAATMHYIVGIGVALAVGSVMRFASINSKPLVRHQAIAVTALVWIFAAFFAALPLYLSGHYGSYLDALFEGVSGFTATGLTLVQDIDHMSMADNMWRFAMQLVGGQGVVVVALSLGLFTSSGSSFYNAEAREDAIVPNIKKTAQFIWRFSLIIVVVGTVLLSIVAMTLGIDPVRSLFHGLWITIGAYDTGGFAPQSQSIMYYHSWAFEVLSMIIMLIGAVNFALYALAMKRGWRAFFADLEIRTLFVWIVVMVLVFVAALIAGNVFSDYSSLVRRGVYTIVSATTNTGYQVLSTSQITTMFSSGAFFLVAIAMTIGGSAGSTAGGIKALRVGLIAKGIVARLKSVLAPQSARVTVSYAHLGNRILAGDMLSGALIVAAIYIMTYVIGSLVAIALGYDAIPAAFESISATSNAGLSAGLTNPSAPAILKTIYIIAMWMGRLEFLTVLALIASLFASILPKPRPKPSVRFGETKR
jgi:trk system potassium uptake protein TrkH